MNSNEPAMKYFICDLDRIPGICLGIPAGLAERIIPVTRVQIGLYETEKDEAFFSLPVLFRLKDTAAPHGIILKPAGQVKTVLMTPRIESELEIPDDQIHPLPKVLSEVLVFFNGIHFNSQNMILILNSDFTAEAGRNHGSALTGPMEGA